MDLNVARFIKFVREKGEQKNITELDITYLDALLAVFLKSLKKADGSDYEPGTIQGYSNLIRKYLSLNKENVHQETSFPVAKSSLCVKKKELKEMGKGNHPNRADCLTEYDEELLWQSGALGDHSPKSLVHTLWYLCTKLLGFRGSQEARQMMWSDITLKNENGERWLEFNERLTKTRDGINDVQRDFQTKMFPNLKNPERCPLRLYELYKSMRPKTEKCEAFFLQVNNNPKAKQWYVDGPVGINELGKQMKQICEEAELQGRFTNHSLRRTMCSQLINSRQFDLVTISKLSGHKNPGSLKHYMTPTVKTQKAMCNYLQDTASRANDSVDSCVPELPVAHALDSLEDMPFVPALEQSQTVSVRNSQFHAVETQPCQNQMSQMNQSNFALRAVDTRPSEIQVAQSTSNLDISVPLAHSNGNMSQNNSRSHTVSTNYLRAVETEPCVVQMCHNAESNAYISAQNSQSNVEKCNSTPNSSLAMSHQRSLLQGTFAGAHFHGQVNISFKQ